MTNAEFLADVSREPGSPNRMRVLDHIDRKLHGGLFDEVDELLAMAADDSWVMPAETRLSMLTITNLLPRDMLPSRTMLVRRLESQFTAKIGGERAKGILKYLA